MIDCDRYQLVQSDRFQRPVRGFDESEKCTLSALCVLFDIGAQLAPLR